MAHGRMTIKEAREIIAETPFWNRFTEDEQKAMSMAERSLEAWESVIEEINEVDFYFLISASGSCAAEVLKTSLLNTIKKALKEVEE